MAQIYTGYVGNPYTVDTKQTATVTIGTAPVTASTMTTDYTALVRGDTYGLGDTHTINVNYKPPSTYTAMTVTTTADVYTFSTAATMPVQDWMDKLGAGYDQVRVAAQDALMRFLEDPTAYKSVVDESGRTAYDLARQRVEQDVQTQKEENIEELRGNLAAQGIVGPAAEKMIADMMVESDVQEARAIAELNAQEMAAIDQFARDAQLQAADTFANIYGQEKELGAKREIAGAQLTSAENIELANLRTKAAIAGAELTSNEKTRLAELEAKIDIAVAGLTADEARTRAELQLKADTNAAQMTSNERQTLAGLDAKASIAAAGFISDEIITRLKGDIQKDIQASAYEAEANIKVRLDEGFKLGAADRLEGTKKSSQELMALGYNQNQISAYNSGFMGMAVEEWQSRRDAISQLTLASILNPGAITAKGIDEFLSIFDTGGAPPKDEEKPPLPDIYEPGEPRPGDPDYTPPPTTSPTAVGTYDSGSGKITRDGQPVSYKELTTMFRGAGAYGEPTTETYENLKNTAPALNLSIKNGILNQFESLPTPGQVYVVGGRPMVVKSIAKRKLGGYDTMDFDGNVKETGRVSGRDADTVVLLDLKTGEEQTVAATNDNISRAISINNLDEWAEGLGG